MRTRITVVPAATVLAVAVLSLGAACSSTTTAESDTTTSAPVAVVAAPDPLLGVPITDSGALFTALLGPTDVPDGFVQIPDPVRDLGMDPAPDYDAADKSSTSPTACADVLATIAKQHPGSSADAEVRYSGPNFSSLDEDAASYQNEGAADAFAAVQATFAQCASFAGTDADGVGVDYTLAGRDQSTVGDASTSIRLTVTSDGFTLVSDAIIAVVDSTVVQIVATDQNPVDAQSLTSAATAAVDKIRGATPQL